MCTPVETKAMVYEAFDEEGGLKEQMMDEFKNEINRSVVRILLGFGVAFLTMVITGTVYVSNLQADVEDLNDFAASGERFTSTDAELLRIQIEANQAALDNVANKEQFDELKEAFIRLDERLRNKGI